MCEQVIVEDMVSCQSELTFAVGKSNGQRRGFRLALTHVRSRIPHPAPIAAYVGFEMHIGNDYHELSSTVIGSSVCLSATYRSDSRRLLGSCPFA